MRDWSGMDVVHANPAVSTGRRGLILSEFESIELQASTSVLVAQMQVHKVGWIYLPPTRVYAPYTSE